MLELQNLVINYDKHRVINQLSIQFEMQKIHGLVGFNGSGKTTLLQAIFGTKKLSAGKILLAGKTINHRDIAYLPTSNFFYSYLTGREYLRLFPQKNPHFKQDVWEELMHLPLDELIEHYSTGMKKKLALIAILKLDKKVILLDEPFNGLDLESGKILNLLLDRLAERGKTVIITSHIIETLTASCHQIHLLEKGNIQKTFDRENFDSIEKELFDKFITKANDLLDDAI
ncbi:MAG: ATP-binding cassette domain-containing protein [Bacteroidota bacterium]